jgi:arginase family enzyme
MAEVTAAVRVLIVDDDPLADLRVVSADIVEVAPVYDHAEITGIAAAHVAFELLSVMARTKGG